MMYRPHGVGLSAYSTIIRTVYTMVVGTLLIAFLYKVLPRRHLRFVAQLPGAALAIAAVYVFSLGVSIYVGQFNGFSSRSSLAPTSSPSSWPCT